MTLQQLLETLTESIPNVEVKDSTGTIMKFAAYSYSAFNEGFLGRTVRSISIANTTTLEVTVVDENEEEES